MKTGDANDINSYGATNDAEFFAVITEYFFEQPQELKANHPNVYNMLDNMFNKGKN
jgi:Mlc titration factor MtfA (ptsG expression regulator)